jgi:hypothetical protein
MLDVVSKEVAELAVIEQKPSMEGRRMVMVLGPRSGVIRPASPTAPVQVSAAPGTATRPASAADGPVPTGSTAPKS